MAVNQFFKKKGPFNIKNLFPSYKLKEQLIIKDIKNLALAEKNHISFFDSIDYQSQAYETKAGCCITTDKLKDYLPNKCIKIVVKNVLFELATITKKFYPDADIDYPEISLKHKGFKKYKKVKFGNNVLIGKFVEIGQNSIIGNNSIIESNVKLGKNCVIGSGCIIKKSIIGDDVVIQDNCTIGQKGFGFIPLKNKNIKFPHIGKVVIQNNVEIASSCCIDRGSLDDTIIGENTYLDNQVHVAHNVKIGNNCMIAGQVGLAGSCTIGDNVSIGGQAGVSGHLKIGNNVKIGGGSGVVKNISDNQVVMGYPAVNLKEFLRKNKK